MPPASPASASIRLERLGKRFGATQVVRGVSLEIAPGEVFALLGPSGCGKTTTLRLVAGLEQPDEGAVYIGDRLMNGVPVEQRDVGLLFQSYALFPHRTVLGNVMFGLRSWRRRIPHAKARALALDALRLVRLDGYDNRYPAQLSGGQQQRVALARAVVLEPRVLLLDEPLSALDKNLRTTMQAELRALIRRLGLTTILVTHDQEEAMTIADRIAVMNQGELVQVGSAADLYERPVSTFVADFVGSTNLITGTVFEEEGARVLVTEAGARLWLGAVAATPGSRRTVAVRPERIGILGQGGSAPRNRVSGQVETVTYKGPSIVATVRLADASFVQVALPNLGSGSCVPAPGESFTLCWADDANVLLEE